jgi:hypothetical protein
VRCTYTPKQADGRGPLSDSRACVEMENGAFFCSQGVLSLTSAVSASAFLLVVSNEVRCRSCRIAL